MTKVTGAECGRHETTFIYLNVPWTTKYAKNSMKPYSVLL